MRHHCLVLIATFAALSAGPAASQAPPTARTTFCLEERAAEACSLTVLLSPAVHAIAGTSGESENGTGGTERFPHFKPFQYTLSLVVLRDVGTRDAAGGFLQVGLANKQQVRVAAGGRYRWRRGERVAIDVSPGMVHMQMPGETTGSWRDHEPRIGFTGDVDLHLDHWAILTTRLDVIPTRTGTAVGLGAGLKADGTPGNRAVLLLVGAVVAALAYYAMMVGLG